MKRIIVTIVVTLTILLLVSSVLAARRHRWYSNQSNTYGWEIMTPEEQKAYHIKMQSLTNHAECSVHIDEHIRKMKARAMEKGVVLPEININTCDIMRNRHMFK